MGQERGGHNKPIQTRSTSQPGDNAALCSRIKSVMLGGLRPGLDFESSERVSINTASSEINNNLPRDEEKVCPAPLAPERHSLTQKLLTRKTICL